MDHPHTPLPPDDDESDEFLDDAEPIAAPKSNRWSLSGAPRGDEIRAGDDNSILGFDINETPSQRRARFEGLTALSSNDESYGFTPMKNRDSHDASKTKPTTTQPEPPPSEPSVTPSTPAGSTASVDDAPTPRLIRILTGLTIFLGLIGVGLTLGIVHLASRPAPQPRVVEVTKPASAPPPVTTTATQTASPLPPSTTTITSTASASPTTVTTTATRTTTATATATTTATATVSVTTTAPAAQPTTQQSPLASQP